MSDEVQEAAEQATNRDGTAFNDDQVKAIKQFLKDMSKIDAERKALNDKVNGAKEDLLNHCPGINMEALLIVYKVWTKADEETDASITLENLGSSLADLSTVFGQAKLW